GRQVPYDKLILATGSRPNIIPFPGHDLDNVLGFRTLEDVDKMLAASKAHTNAVVIGGGLLGLEAASGLKRQGMQVTVIHSSAFLLNRQIDPNAANLLQQALLKEGVQFAMSARTAKLMGNAEKRVVAVELNDGTQIPADLVVFATGVKPNMELAQSSGIYCQHGIIVNDTMQTFDPAIYAVGECVQHRGELFGLVAPLFQQAKVCANHVAELGYSRYQQTPVATKLKVTGIDVYSAGEFLANEEDEEYDIITYEDVDKAIYKKLVIKDNQLVGAVLFGDIIDGAFYFDLIQEHTDITAYRNLLMFGKAFCQPASSEAPAPVQAA
ncbi:MAG: FAD-dependent oxidoreductase, partial [Pseudomonadales bacterium]|nr:FAD-dependent oxidoreductase [Pseudomonadales bacterium]